MVFQQQCQYFKSINRQGYPRDFFQVDLSNFLQESISQVFAIILCIGGNENMQDSKVQCILQNAGLVELSQIFSNDLPVASHILGSQQIDTVWSIPNINLSSLSILPYHLQEEIIDTLLLTF